MKSLLLGLLMLLTSFTINAQAFLGEKKDSIMYYLNTAHYDFTVERGQDNNEYIASWLDSTRVRAWFLNTNERCIAYLQLEPEKNYNIVSKRLAKMYRKDGNRYYDEETHVCWKVNVKDGVLEVVAEKYE